MQSSRTNIGGLKALLALCDVKRNLLAVLKGFEAFSLNFREVGKKIITAVIRRDEAETFCIVKPLDSTSCHYQFPYKLYVIASRHLLLTQLM